MEAPPIRWHRIFAVLIAVACVIELVAQVFTYAWAEQPYRSFSKYRWSPYGLVRNNPELSMPGYQINANGFRDTVDYTVAKPPHTFRVLMVGGSVLYSPLAGKTVAGVERVDSSSTIAQFFEQELRADPAFDGVRVEVLNAAVNFNKIPEVATAYLAEYAVWNADLVILFGSGNNFPAHARAGEVAERQYGLQKPHPWRLEFERIANERSWISTVEHVVNYAEAELASVAWAKKAGAAIVDKLFAISEDRALVKPPPRTSTPASFTEFDSYISEYLGYVDAMAAVARRRGQAMVVFWEYFLPHLDGIKPLSSVEQPLAKRLSTRYTPLDVQFNFYARDKVAAYLETQGIHTVDPLDTLRATPATVFSDHIHYTREGNQLMARTLYRDLRERLHRLRANVR